MFKYRTLTVLIGALLLFPSLTYALSLGEIKVKSSFAQPFFAEIAIPSYTSDELESLEVRLAPAAKFETLGLELYPYLESFNFIVEKKPDGTPFVKVFSQDPVKELSISFVIEVSWLGGKILKDFHILLTPEAITELREEQLMHRQLAQIDSMPTPAPAPEINEPSRQSSEPIISEAVTDLAQAPSVPDIQDSAPPQRPERSSSKVKKFGANGIQYTRVGRGENLSQIAIQLKDDNVSLNQAMVTLYEQNLNAFVGQDINKLKAGATLKVEDINDFKQRSKREAMLLAQQYLDNKQNPTTESTIAQAEEIPAPEPENQGARLEISSVEEEPVPAEIMAKLKQEQIASTEEELRFARQTAEELQAQNEILKERIAALELRMDEMAASLLQAEAPVPTSAPHDQSASQQDDNLIVTNTDAVVNDQRDLTFIEMLQKYQLPLSIFGAIVLSLILIYVRKKEQIHEFLAGLRDKPDSKSETEIA